MDESRKLSRLGSVCVRRGMAREMGVVVVWVVVVWAAVVVQAAVVVWWW